MTACPLVIRLTRAQIAARLRLDSLTPTLLDAFRGNKMAQSVAEALSKLPAKSQAKLEKVLAKQERLTMDDVRAEKTVRRVKAVEEMGQEVFAGIVPEKINNWRDQLMSDLDRLRSEVGTGKDASKLLKKWMVELSKVKVDDGNEESNQHQQRAGEEDGDSAAISEGATATE